MKFFQLFFSAFILASSLHASAGELLKRTVEISAIDSVEIQGPGNLEISQGDTELLEIIASENVLPRVDVSARGNNLKLRLKGKTGFGLFSFDQDVHYKLQVKNIHHIQTTGSVDIKALTALHSDGLTIHRTGSGDIYLQDLTSNTLHIKAAGAGDFKAGKIRSEIIDLESAGAGDYNIEQIAAKEIVRFDFAGAGDLRINKLEASVMHLNIAGAGDARIDTGEVEMQEISISGSGDFHAAQLKSKTAKLRLSGAANAKVCVTDHLEGAADGASDIEYYGKPNAKVRSSGASSINAVGREP